VCPSFEWLQESKSGAWSSKLRSVVAERGRSGLVRRGKPQGTKRRRITRRAECSSSRRAQSPHGLLFRGQAFWIVKLACSFTRAAGEAISTSPRLASGVKTAGASRSGDGASDVGALHAARPNRPPRRAERVDRSGPRAVQARVPPASTILSNAVPVTSRSRVLVLENVVCRRRPDASRLPGPRRKAMCSVRRLGRRNP
jgi:hypothetical protein